MNDEARYFINKYLKDEEVIVSQWHQNKDLKMVCLSKPGLSFSDQREGFLSFANLRSEDIESIHNLTTEELERILKVIELKKLKDKIVELESDLNIKI